MTESATISKSVFLGLIWGFISVATLLTFFRFSIRIKTFRTLYADDAWVAAAWVTALASVIMWQTLSEDMYRAVPFISGKKWPPTPEDVDSITKAKNACAAFTLLFYASVWCIKMSFLFFFRRLYQSIGHVMRIWWFLVVIVVATWAVAIGTVDYKCEVGPYLPGNDDNCHTKSTIRTQRIVISFNCATDALTDLAILCIPFSMLWKTKISLKRRLALGSVFAVTLITIIITVVRAIATANSITNVDMTWMEMWPFIQMLSALIVACLGSFRTLFVTQASAKQARNRCATTTHEKSIPARTGPRFRNLPHFLSGCTDRSGHPCTLVTGDTINGIISLYDSSNREEVSRPPKVRLTASQLEACELYESDN